jgi:hypothetical protein
MMSVEMVTTTIAMTLLFGFGVAGQVGKSYEN